LPKKLPEILLLLAFPIFFATIAVRWNWVLPAVSDPLEYLRSVPWGSSYGYFPWLDRLALGGGLGLFGWLPWPVYVTGPLYILSLHLSVLCLGLWWLYRQVGFGAAVLFGIFFNCSWYFLFFSTQIFPESTVIFYSFLAFIFFHERKRSELWPLALAGFFAGFVFFTKATAAFFPPLLFLILFREKGWHKDLALFSGGILAGVLGVFLLFILVYDLASFQDAFVSFFSSNLQFNIQGRAEYNNPVNYVEVLLHKNHIPVFLGLFVAVGMYKDLRAKIPALIAWVFVTTVALIYIFSDRGYVPIHNYLYPGFFFASLALSAYLGSFVDLGKKFYQKAFWLGTGLLAVFLGLFLGRWFDPSGIFEAGYFAHLPKWASVLFNGGLFLSAILLLASEIRQSKKLVLSFTLVAGFWSAAHGGGLVRSHMDKILKPEVSFYYEQVGLLNENPKKGEDLAVFVQAWNKERNPDRIVILYEILYGPEADQAGQPKHLRQKRFSDNLRMTYLFNEKELHQSKAKIFLVDNLHLIQKLFSTWKVLKETDWRGRKYWFVESN